MTDTGWLGKTLILVGAVLIISGLLLTFGKFSWFGRLPGDIYIQKKNIAFFFPITTAIIISVVLSIVLILLRRR